MVHMVVCFGRFGFGHVFHWQLLRRVAFGVSASGGMKNSLVAIATPETGTAGFYTTSATSKSTPKVVRVGWYARLECASQCMPLGFSCVNDAS